MTRPYTSHKRVFSDAFIDTARAGTYTDKGCPGLKLRVAPAGGKKSFYHQWQLPGAGEVGTRGKPKRGPIRKVHVGRYPAVSLSEARAVVTAQRAEYVDHGNSPVVLQPTSREVADGLTFGEVAQQVLGGVQNNTTLHDFDRYLLPALRNRNIRDITRLELATVLDEAHDPKKPSREGRVLGHLKKIFGIAIERGYIDADPTFRMKRGPKSKRRTRVLDLDELRAVWNACADEDGKVFACGAATRLLLLTGQRRGETSVAKWDDLDLASGVWTIPWQNRKGGTEEIGDHRVFLSGAAQHLLITLKNARQPDSGPYVFSFKNGRKAITSWKPFKARLDESLPKMPSWVIHNFRHTMITGMADLGVAPHVISRVVGHTMTAVTSNDRAKEISPTTTKYLHSDFDDERSAAMDLWADHVLPDTVVQLGKRGARR
ncbi:MAG: site-specific integrase [Alphaproteobacteria bacterium]|nr:site-specific integrase [Alphaproteobacteria bacterium]